MDEMTLTLNNPITEEQWDAITDVDFEHTNEITFYTKHGKEVKFVKASAQADVPDMNVGDMVSRQAVIDKLKREKKILYSPAGAEYLIRAIEDLPSAQPYTDEEIKKIQDIEQAQFDKICELAYQEGKADAMRWIPCSERLPEDEKEVLVTRHFLSDTQLKKNAITEAFYVEVASRIDDEWTSYSDEYKIKAYLHKVIAWMPLPEPYAGRRTDERSD